MFDEPHGWVGRGWMKCIVIVYKSFDVCRVKILGQATSNLSARRGMQWAIDRILC